MPVSIDQRPLDYNKDKLWSSSELTGMRPKTWLCRRWTKSGGYLEGIASDWHPADWPVWLPLARDTSQFTTWLEDPKSSQLVANWCHAHYVFVSKRTITAQRVTINDVLRSVWCLKGPCGLTAQTRILWLLENCSIGSDITTVVALIDWVISCEYWGPTVEILTHYRVLQLCRDKQLKLVKAIRNALWLGVFISEELGGWKIPEGLAMAWQCLGQRYGREWDADEEAEIKSRTGHSYTMVGTDPSTGVTDEETFLVYSGVKCGIDTLRMVRGAKQLREPKSFSKHVNQRALEFPNRSESINKPIVAHHPNLHRQTPSLVSCTLMVRETTFVEG